MAFKSFKFKVSEHQILHVEISGNPKGFPVLLLHGGPGAGMSGKYQWPFDTDHYQIIAFDQRGCGKSQPFCDVTQNTTQHLVNDIELLRQHLNINKWFVFGGSWGATLALVYAIQFPNRCASMILRGTFLARKEDFDWFLCPNGAAANIYPVDYQQFVKDIASPLNGRSICEHYYQRMLSTNVQESRDACVKWFNWEVTISRLQDERVDPLNTASIGQIKSLALLECHYLLNQCFLPANYMLKNTHRIQDIPTFIVHGRYDMVCKVESSIALHDKLPNSELYLIENAGHCSQEPGIKKCLKNIMKKLQRKSEVLF